MRRWGLQMLALACVTQLLAGPALGTGRAAEAGPAAAPARLPAHAVARCGSALFRAGGSISSLALAPDGRYVAGGALPICVWNADTGVTVAVLRGHGGCPRGLSYSRDGKLLASAGGDGTVRVWDTASGTELARAEGDAADKFTAVLTPDGRTLVVGRSVGNRGYTIELYDARTGRRHRALVPGETPDGGGFPRLVCSSGAPACVSALGRRLRFWDSRTWRLVREVEGHASDVTALALTPDGKRVASAGREGVVRCWDVTTGQVAGPDCRGTSPFLAVAYSADGKVLVTGDLAGRIETWNPVSGRRLGGGLAGNGPILCLLALPGGKQVGFGDNNHILRRWDIGRSRPCEDPDGHSQGVHDVAFIEQDRTVLTAGDDGTLRRWRATDGAPLGTRRVGGHTWAPRLTPDARRGVSQGEAGPVLLWDTDRPETPTPAAAEIDTVWTMCWSHDGRTLAILDTRAAACYDVGRRQLTVVRRQDPSGNWVHAALDRDGRRLALAGTGDSLMVADTASGRAVATFSLGGELWSLRFDPTGRLLFAGTSDRQQWMQGGRVTVWDVAAGRAVGRFAGFPSPATALAASPDSRLLAIGHFDGDVRIWELASGQEVGRFRGHTARVAALAFAAEGRRLVSGSDDTTALVWDLAAARTQTAGARGQPGQRIEPLWAELRAADAVRARAACWQLVDAGGPAVDFVRAALARPAGPSEREVRQWVADLDDDNFETRERASRRLRGLSRERRRALGAALASALSPEARRRLTEIVEAPGEEGYNAEELRAIRGVEVLEHVGSAEALRALTALAAGGGDGVTTREARTAAERLRQSLHGGA